MKLTVLGAYGPYPPYGGACTGFLLENENTRILLDCGNGILSRLQKYVKPWELDGIIISHLHSDHVSDLFILRYALDIAGKSVDLYMPENPAEEAVRIPYKEVYNITGIEHLQNINIGSLEISFHSTVHPYPCLAMKVTSGNKTLVYSGDTEYFSELPRFAEGCDLFICEANYQDRDMNEPRSNHLSAAQAAEIAGSAGAKRLLLSHLPPGRNINISLREALAVFPGAALAVEDEQHSV